jgi:hypothetical protein
MKGAFARHLRHVARLYPGDMHERGMPVSDNDRWHIDKPVDGPSADHPYLEFPKMSSFSPPLNQIGRFRRRLRRQAT